MKEALTQQVEDNPKEDAPDWLEERTCHDHGIGDGARGSGYGRVGIYSFGVVEGEEGKNANQKVGNGVGDHGLDDRFKECRRILVHERRPGLGTGRMRNRQNPPIRLQAALSD